MRAASSEAIAAAVRNVPVAYEFNASRRVIEGDFLDRLEPAQQSLALLQSSGVRIDMRNLPETGARVNDQVMLYAQGCFGNYLERVPGKQIIILVDASGERVLNRDDAALRFASNYCIKNIFEGKTGDRFYLRIRISCGRHAG